MGHTEQGDRRLSGLVRVRPEDDSGSGLAVIELGYRLHQAAWGNGYATEGSRALIDKGFQDLGLERVPATTMAVNTGSRRVMEKAGLSFVRHFSQEWPETIEGSEHGDVVYELTRAQWERRRGDRRRSGGSRGGEGIGASRSSDRSRR